MGKQLRSHLREMIMRDIVMDELRVIEFRIADNGDKITRYEDGTTYIEKSRGGKLWTDEKGEVRRGENADGTTFVRPKRIPLEEQPLNVYSRDPEELGRLLSNFAVTPFVLDGKAYASIEGFYAAIKYWENPKEQKRVARLSGSEAKNASKKCIPDVIVYGGKSMLRGSPEHHDLIKAAIRAKLQYHPDIAERFRRSKPRPITHETGVQDKPGATFPATVFVRILTELRDELEPK